MKVNNNIQKTGKIGIVIQTLKQPTEESYRHIAYKYGDPDGNGDRVYQAWLVKTDNNYPIETDTSKILAEIDNIAICLKRRWANQAKSVGFRIEFESRLDQIINTYKQENQ